MIRRSEGARAPQLVMQLCFTRLQQWHEAARGYAPTAADSGNPNGRSANAFSASIS